MEMKRNLRKTKLTISVCYVPKLVVSSLVLNLQKKCCYWGVEGIFGGLMADCNVFFFLFCAKQECSVGFSEKIEELKVSEKNQMQNHSGEVSFAKVSM